MTGKHPINVEQLKILLQQRRIFQPRFRLPLNLDDAVELLYAAVVNEVAYRGNTFVPSQAINECILQAAAWCIDNKKMGLMLCGLPGNGKTTVMNAICQVFKLFDFKDVHGEPVRIRSVSAVEVAQMAKSNYKAFKNLCYNPFLAIDDFGEEPVEVLEYGNVLSPITDMLSIRYSEQLLTILTTNTAANKIRERYGARIADRFNEMMRVIIFTNPSYRGQK